MEIQLKKKLDRPRLLEGFPGFGLVGTIATEFLIEHLKCEEVGRIMIDEIPSMVAIHDNKVVQPLGLHYSKDYNLLILHAVTTSQGIEWKLVEALLALQKEINAPEIISLEGVGGAEQSPDPQTFFYATHKEHQEKLKKMGMQPLKEGIIIGVTGGLLIKAGHIPVTCFFAETTSNLPDSTAAAHVITALDKYLNMKVDPQPLLEQAKQMESKLKNILTQSQKTQELSEAKKLSYMG